MDSEYLLVEQIAGLIRQERISVFNLQPETRFNHFCFYQAELEQHLSQQEDTFLRIYSDIENVDDILSKQVLFARIFQYCEECNMFFQRLNPFYRQQREIQFYKRDILKYQEALLREYSKNTCNSLNDAMISFMLEHLSQHSHVMKIEKHEQIANIFLIVYREKPVRDYLNCDIYLYRVNNNGKTEENCCIQIKEENLLIRIGDITGSQINCGYGSMLMSYLKEYAKSRGKIQIVGHLSFVDRDAHEARLIHFYEKNGFRISEPDKTGWPKITYDLREEDE